MQPSGEQRNRPARPATERAALARELARRVGENSILWTDDSLLAYDVDGFTLAKFPPDLVVLPTTTAQVAMMMTVSFRRIERSRKLSKGHVHGSAGTASPAQVVSSVCWGKSERGTGPPTASGSITQP